MYVSHWENHPDVKNRTPMFQEESFAETVILPSGREVLWKGKMDAVDKILEGPSKKRMVEKIYLQENKTRGEVDPQKMVGELPMNFQSM